MAMLRTTPQLLADGQWGRAQQQTLNRYSNLRKRGSFPSPRDFLLLCVSMGTFSSRRLWRELENYRHPLRSAEPLSRGLSGVSSACLEKNWTLSEELLRQAFWMSPEQDSFLLAPEALRACIRCGNFTEADRILDRAITLNQKMDFDCLRLVEAWVELELARGDGHSALEVLADYENKAPWSTYHEEIIQALNTNVSLLVGDHDFAKCHLARAKDAVLNRPHWRVYTEMDARISTAESYLLNSQGRTQEAKDNLDSSVSRIDFELGHPAGLDAELLDTLLSFQTSAEAQTKATKALRRFWASHDHSYEVAVAPYRATLLAAKALSHRDPVQRNVLAIQALKVSQRGANLTAVSRVLEILCHIIGNGPLEKCAQELREFHRRTLGRSHPLNYILEDTALWKN